MASANTLGSASGYVVRLEGNRRQMFVDLVEERDYFAEPVPKFQHSNRIPLIAFVVSGGASLEYLASASKGKGAGTGLVKLNLSNIHKLDSPIEISELVEAVGGRVRRHVEERFSLGGALAPSSFQSVCEAIIRLAPDCGDLLRRFSQARYERVATLSNVVQRRLAEQKEALATAMRIAGMDRSVLQDWDIPDGTPGSFLDGLPQVYLREDAMLLNDFNNFPGVDLIRTVARKAAVFESSSTRLTVIMANRDPLEELTGTDLIYFNELLQTFLMVQYKAMEKEGEDTVFRLPNQQLSEEVRRMQSVLNELKKCEIDHTADGFRFNHNPFFIKFCNRIELNPDDAGLIGGMYIPLEYWLALEGDPRLVGPQGGVRLTHQNSGRYFSNTNFANFVQNGWIGTSGEQTNVLEAAIRTTVESGRAATIAIQSKQGE